MNALGYDSQQKEVIMKIDLYADIHHPIDLSWLTFQPLERMCQKVKGSKRVKITVNLPDSIIEQVDIFGSVEEVKEVDK